MTINPVVAQSQQARAVENFHLSKSLENLLTQWKQFKKAYYESDIYESYEYSKKVVNKEFYAPIKSAWKNTYNELPQETTKAKLKLLERFTYRQRFIFLNLLAVLSAVSTMRGISRFNAWGLGMKSLRNTALTYVFGGLLVAPEIYNPILIRWKQLGRE